MNLGASNAETDSLDFAVRLLAVGVSANCARTSAQSTARAVTEPGTSTPSGFIPNRHSGLDTMRCDTANYYALPAPVGSAQPIAHCGVLPVDPMTTARTVAPNHGGRANTRGCAVVASCIYGCTKLQASIADAGSIPATSTTTGVHGFDGMLMGNGQLVMAPTVSGSAWSGVRCDGPNSQTPMTAFIRLRRQLDVPAARNGTRGRHLLNGRNAQADVRPVVVGRKVA